jgi:hypothetical protein
LPNWDAPHSNGQIQEGSITWKKAQDAIKLLRQGKSKEEAISRSGVGQTRKQRISL